MKRCLYLLFILLCTTHVAWSQAGDDRLKELNDKVKLEGEGWKSGGAFGTDFAQLALINPKIGGGDNKIGLGGLGTFFTNYKKGKLYWDNNFSLQLAVQELADAPWQKSLDVLRLGSRIGSQIKGEKLSAALDVQLQTLLLNTYEGNILNPKEEDSLDVVAKLFSPATISVSPGLDWKPNAHFSLFYSPASLRMLYVADKKIADLDIHGNEKNKQSRLSLGSNVKALYTNKYYNEKVALKSSLDLYSDYLDKPQNIDVLWSNDIGVALFKNLSLNLLVETFYDDNVSVIKDKDKYKANKTGTGKAVSITEALYIKYNWLF